MYIFEFQKKYVDRYKLVINIFPDVKSTFTKVKINAIFVLKKNQIHFSTILINNDKKNHPR